MKYFVTVPGFMTPFETIPQIAQTDDLVRMALQSCNAELADANKYWIERKTSEDVCHIDFIPIQSFALRIGEIIQPIDAVLSLNDADILARAVQVDASLKDGIVERTCVAGVLELRVHTRTEADAAQAAAAIADALRIGKGNLLVVIEGHEEWLNVSAPEKVTNGYVLGQLSNRYPICKNKDSLTIERELSAMPPRITIKLRPVTQYIAVLEETEPVVIDPAIAVDDNKLRDFLKVYGEGVSSAAITRQYKNGVQTITLAKQGREKGSLERVK